MSVEPYAVRHRQHHLAFDGRDRLQLVLHVPPPGLLDCAEPALRRLGVKGGGRRSGQGRGDDEVSTAVRSHMGDDTAVAIAARRPQPSGSETLVLEREGFSRATGMW